MKTFFKVVIWIAAALLGLFVWNVLPDFRPLVSSILAAAFVCYVLSILLKSPLSVSYRTNSWSFAAVWTSWIARLLQSCGMHLNSVAFDDGGGDLAAHIKRLRHWQAAIRIWDDAVWYDLNAQTK